MKSGIYKITNNINGLIYIGSSQNMSVRWKQHIYYLNSDKHHNVYLQASWNLHGVEAFEFSIVEFCEKLNLEEREQYWLGTLTPHIRSIGYNFRPMANNNTGLKFTEEHKRKISEAHKGKIVSDDTRILISMAAKNISQETRNKLSLSASARTHTDKTKAKMSERHKGKTVSPETRAKISASNTGRIVSPEIREN